MFKIHQFPLGTSSKNIFQKIKYTCISLPIDSSLLLASKRLNIDPSKELALDQNQKQKKENPKSGSMVLHEYQLEAST